MIPPDIEKTLLENKISARSDDELIEKINKLAVTEGPLPLKRTFNLLAGVDIPLDDCLAHWESAQGHRQEIIHKLQRNVDLTTSLSDYFQQKTDYLDHPRLIEAKKLEDVVKKTIIDKLTGLFNRRYFDEAYEQQVALAKRYQENFTVLFLDIDNFKLINDHYGHRAGDKVLQEIATVISDEKRNSDLAARYGGEEFVLLLTHTDNAKAYIFAERLRKRVEEHDFSLEGDTVKITLSGGIASFPFNSQNPSQLLQMADRAMYLSKGAGKNRITHYREEKRRYLRVQINSRIKVKKVDFENSPVMIGTCKDISVGGILFENKKRFPVGTLIQTQLSLKDDDFPVILIGTVIREESIENGNYRIGLATSFKELDYYVNKEVAAILPNENFTD